MKYGVITLLLLGLAAAEDGHEHNLHDHWEDGGHGHDHGETVLDVVDTGVSGEGYHM